MPLSSTEHTVTIRVGAEPPPDYAKYVLAAGAIILTAALIIKGVK